MAIKAGSRERHSVGSASDDARRNAKLMSSLMIAGDDLLASSTWMPSYSKAEASGINRRTLLDELTSADHGCHRRRGGARIRRAAVDAADCGRGERHAPGRSLPGTMRR